MKKSKKKKKMMMMMMMMMVMVMVMESLKLQLLLLLLFLASLPFAFAILTPTFSSSSSFLLFSFLYLFQFNHHFFFFPTCSFYFFIWKEKGNHYNAEHTIVESAMKEIIKWKGYLWSTWCVGQHIPLNLFSLFYWSIYEWKKNRVCPGTCVHSLWELSSIRTFF